MEIYRDAAQLLGEKKLARLTQNVTLHQQYQLEDLAEANHWGLAEALEIILANGLAFFEAVKLGRISLEKWVEPEEPGEELLPAIANHWQGTATRLDTRYATLKFMAFRLMQNNQTLRFNLSGLTNGLGMAGGTTAFLQKERQRLEQLNRLLRQENCVITPATQNIPSAAPQQPAPAKTSQNHDPNLVVPKITYFPGGAACYELNVIEELYEASSNRQATATEEPPNPEPDPLLDMGLLVLEGVTNSQTGDLPLAVLERAGLEIGWQPNLTRSPGETLNQTLKALDHFITARSTTLVMEGKVAFLKTEGEQLEEEVQLLREQEWAWHEWSTTMRTYLARLEQENRQLKEPQHLESIQPEAPKFSLIKWFKEKLFTGQAQM